MNQERIGRFIAEMRRETGMTQQQLADALNISNRTVSKWECGEGLPELANILPLCSALRITADELLKAARTEADSSEPVPGGKEEKMAAYSANSPVLSQIMRAAAERVRPQTDVCAVCGGGFNRKETISEFDFRYRYLLTYEERISEPMCLECAIAEVEENFDQEDVERIFQNRPRPCLHCGGDYPYCLPECRRFRI